MKDDLQKLTKQFSHKKWRFVNHGGCCLFAVFLADELKKLGYNPALVVFNHASDGRGYDWLDIEDPYHYDCWEANNVLFYHVMVKVRINRKVYYIDSEQVTNGLKATEEKNRLAFAAYLPLDVAERFAKCQSLWNPCFDRNLSPLMYRKIARWANSLPQKA